MEKNAHHKDIKNLKDWYHVSLQEVRQAGGGGLCSHYSSMYDLLVTHYPEYPDIFLRSLLLLDIRGMPPDFIDLLYEFLEDIGITFKINDEHWIELPRS